MSSPEGNYEPVSVELPTTGSQARLRLFVFYMLIGASYLVPFWHVPPTGSARWAEYITLGTIMVVSALVHLWLGMAKLMVSVDSQELRVAISAFGLRSVNRYSLKEVSNLRVEYRRIFTERRWLAIDRKGKRKFIGGELAEWAEDKLLTPIYAKFPLLQPRLMRQGVPEPIFPPFDN